METSIFVELQTSEWDCGVQCYRAYLALRGVDVSWEQAVGEVNASEALGTSDYGILRALGNRNVHLLSLGNELWLRRIRERFEPAFLCLEHGAHWCLALASPSPDVLVLFDPEIGLAVIHTSVILAECVGVLSI